MKIAFTSCTRYESFSTQPQWQDIYDCDPDYLFLLGDNIYMDYGFKPLSKEPNGSPKHLSDKEFESRMRKKYTNQFERVPEFKALVKKMRGKNGFYGIWDDHDFAWNDAVGTDVSPEKKKITRALFHEYMNCSTNLPHTYYHVDTEQARVIFMDVRWDSERKGNSNILISDKQFDFIQDKLNHEKKYTVLCSGLTLTEGPGEKWSKYPSQLKRLCQLLKDKSNVLFLAGDIHRNKYVPPMQLSSLNATTPFQLISSGLAVNFLGLPIGFDDCHNWALLELSKHKVEINFFNKYGLQRRKSRKANNKLKTYLAL